MTKLTLIISILLILLTTNCGFKVVNDSNLKNFKIAEIITTGDKRINYKIKNKLISFASKNEKKLIKLNLVSNKIKSIKEKNIKNEITKYQIKISVTVTYNEIQDINFKKFIIHKIGDFSATNQYSQTLSNEKNLIKLLTDNLADEIIEKIIQNINVI